jgi:hypothetical protein
MNDQTETRPHIGQAEILEAEPTIAEAAAQALVPTAPTELQVVDPNPLSMLASALQQGHDVDKLGKLMDLAERYEANEARKAFATALSKFQAACPPIVDNKVASVHTKDGGSYSYSYADLDGIMSTIRPTMKKCGLSVRFNTAISDDGKRIKSICYVQHRDGHVEETEFVAPVDDQLKINDSQKMGSANSYASRYNLVNALGLTTGEDDDGAAGDTKRGAAPAPKSTNLGEFFPVGKHKGDKWDDVPVDYLEWCIANLTDKPDIVAKCQQHVDARLHVDAPAPDESGEPTMAECARWITNAKTVEELTEAWSLVPAKHSDGLTPFYNTRKGELNA